MAFQDIATFQLQARLPDGQAIRNTLHFRRNPSAGDVDATWLAAWLADANTTTLITAYRALFPNTARIEGVLGRATLDPTDTAAERDESYRVVDLAGSLTPSSTFSPDELTAILKINGDLAGRRYRGRLWLPPPLNTGAITGEYVNTAATWWTNVVAWVAELTKTTYPSGGSHYGGAWNDCDMVVFSRAARLANATYYARVPAVVTGTKLHWLRSRNPTLA
jgi:hypothetical protein